ncbi:MAG: efflux RND transporter periplasmic adaptor subunit [Candidatus Brocadiia bacterium]
MSAAKTLTGLFVLLLIVAATGLGVLYKLGAPAETKKSIEEIQARQGLPVEVVQPSRRDFPRYLRCDGRVAADVRAFLRAKIGEVVEAVHVRVGEPVEEGQLVVELRKTDLEAQVQAAQMAHEEARRRYERNKVLFEQEVISEDRLEQLGTAMENAAANLRLARSRLAFAEIRSPIDGMVEARFVEPGEFKGVGKELLSVVDLSTVEVRALVPQQDVPALSVGMAGQYQLEAASQWRSGTISRAAPSTEDPNRFFDVYLRTDNEQVNGGWLMKPGMYAEVRFLTEVAEDALAVPAACVRYEGNVRAAYLVEEGKARVPVPPETSAAPGFVGRVVRGVHKLQELRGRRNGEDETEYEEVEGLVARRVEVTVLDEEQGYVRIAGNPIGENRRVVVNPRDALRDGLLVRVVEGEED